MALRKRTSASGWAGLNDALGRREKPLAVATGDDDLVLVGTRTALALRRANRWQVWGWEQIAHGAWVGEERLFGWRTIAGEREEVKLKEAGQLPELFRERVQASTLQTTVIDVDPGTVEPTDGVLIGDEVADRVDH